MPNKDQTPTVEELQAKLSAAEKAAADRESQIQQLQDELKQGQEVNTQLLAELDSATSPGAQVARGVPAAPQAKLKSFIVAPKGTNATDDGLETETIEAVDESDAKRIYFQRRNITTTSRYHLAVQRVTA